MTMCVNYFFSPLGKVDSAVESIKEDLTSSNLKTQSFGAALIAGGFKDSLADYIDNNRVPSGNILQTHYF